MLGLSFVLFSFYLRGGFPTHEQPIEVLPSEAEWIAFAYRLAARGDAWAALVRAIEDTLADLAEADRRLQERERLISRGYARASAPRA